VKCKVTHEYEFEVKNTPITRSKDANLKTIKVIPSKKTKGNVKVKAKPSTCNSSKQVTTMIKTRSNTKIDESSDIEMKDTNSTKNRKRKCSDKVQSIKNKRQKLDEHKESTTEPQSINLRSGRKPIQISVPSQNKIKKTNSPKNKLKQQLKVVPVVKSTTANKVSDKKAESSDENLSENDSELSSSSDEECSKEDSIEPHTIESAHKSESNKLSEDSLDESSESSNPINDNAQQDITENKSEKTNSNKSSLKEK